MHNDILKIIASKTDFKDETIKKANEEKQKQENSSINKFMTYVSEKINLNSSFQNDRLNQSVMQETKNSGRRTIEETKKPSATSNFFSSLIYKPDTKIDPSKESPVRKDLSRQNSKDSLNSQSQILSPNKLRHKSESVKDLFGQNSSLGTLFSPTKLKKPNLADSFVMEIKMENNNVIIENSHETDVSKIASKNLVLESLNDDSQNMESFNYNALNSSFQNGVMIKPVRKSTFTGMMKLLEGFDKAFIDFTRNYICFMQISNEKNKPLIRGTTIQGDFHGPGEIFHTNGVLKYKGDFRYGGPHGSTCITYHSNNMVSYMGEMINGYITGLGMIFSKTGKVISEGNYIDGKLTNKNCTLYYSNGIKKYEGSMIGDLYSGKGIEFCPNGKIRYSGYFKNGLFHTEVGNKIDECSYEYYESGHIKYIGYFENGQYSGENGKLYH